MAFESVRGYVQLASGLGEMTMARAMEAAQGLLALPGAEEVTRKVVQASTLAEELLDAAKSNRANLVALVQGEVETALKRADVARVADLDAARTALAGVSKELADLRALVVTTGVSAVVGASRGTLGRSGAVSTTARRSAEPATQSAPLAAPRPARKSPATSTAAAPATKASPRKAAARPATNKATASSTPRTAATKKTTAKKAAAPRKAAARTTATKTATAKKTTAKKTTAKKTTAKKTTPKKAPAKKTTARAAATKKATS